MVAALWDASDASPEPPDSTWMASVPASEPVKLPSSKPKTGSFQLVHQLVAAPFTTLATGKLESHELPPASRTPRAISSKATRAFSCTRPRFSVARNASRLEAKIPIAAPTTSNPSTNATMSSMSVMPCWWRYLPPDRDPR